MNYKSIHSIRHYKTVLKWVIIKLVTKVIIKLVVELVVIKIVYTVDFNSSIYYNIKVIAIF